MLIKYNKSNSKELVNKILSTIKEDDNVLIQAGHFPIINNKFGELVPAILDDIEDNLLKEFINSTDYIKDFPSLTFKLGLEIASNLKIKYISHKFIFIVNDWQWLNKGKYDQYLSDRAEFYNNQKLPILYCKYFKEYGYTEHDIIGSNHYTLDNMFWSEFKLRKLGKTLGMDCSPQSCAMEYLPFLNENKEHFDTLISFIPITCKEPILFSAFNFLSKNAKKLIHVFYNPKNENFILSILEQENIPKT